jgi:hypothetical protein
MHTDPLKQALADMETAWRRLREVLDGPDVAAALVERQAIRPMSTVPRDGTWVSIQHENGETKRLRYLRSQWRSADDTAWHEATMVGWSPVK